MKIANVPMESYRIVHAADALPGVRDAALALAKFTAEAVNCTLPVVTDDTPAEPYEILLGPTNRDTAVTAEALAELVDDGFAILTDGTRLYITARLPRGVAYGAYAFMEDYLGLRFLSSRCRYVAAEARDIPADLCRIDNPGFMSRDTYWYDVLFPAAESDFDFQAACRTNRGEMPHLGGGVSYAGRFVHTFPALAGTGTEPGIQPCLTDETVYQTVLANVRKWLDENPAASIISVSQNDSYAHQGGCPCENCRAIDEREGTPMGSLLTFVNRIAEDIKDDYPHIWVDTLAYRYTRKAPRTLKPADNVIIRLCSIECCFSHPLDDPDCPPNADFARDIEEWSAICKHLYIWDYTTDFLFYLAPFPNLGVLRRNVRFFKEHNAIGVFEQGNTQSLSGELGELRAYLLAKLLWNPDMTEEEYNTHMDTFLSGYYGPGWRHIRAYIERTSAIAARRHMHIYDHPHIVIPFDEPTLSEQLIAYWDNALAAAETPEEQEHIRVGRIQVLHHSTFSPEPHPEQKARLSVMYDAIREGKITHFRERVPLPPITDPDNLPLLH